MEYERDAMAEKILGDINTIIDKDSDLKEFDIIPVNGNQNKSPVLHSEETHSLGLESWCVKHVYTYVHERIMQVKFGKMKLSSETLTWLLNGALLLHPDVTTFWNMRRELFKKGLLCIESELRFARVILSRKHKSNEVFAYRRWLIKESGSLSQILTSDLVSKELQVTEMCASRSACNIHAWSHRNWVIQMYLDYMIVPIIIGTPNSQKVTSTMQFILRELDFSEKWIEMNVSDHSGFHHRKFFINYLFSNSNFNNYAIDLINSSYMLKHLENLKIFLCNYYDLNVIHFSFNSCGQLLKHLFDSEICIKKYDNIFFIILIIIYDLNLCSQLSQMYKNHESIWYYRRFLVYMLIQINNEFNPNYKSEKKQLNKLFPIENDGNNIVKYFCTKKHETGETVAKILKVDTNMNNIIMTALKNQEKQFIDETRYFNWCQMVLNFDCAT